MNTHTTKSKSLCGGSANKLLAAQYHTKSFLPLGRSADDQVSAVNFTNRLLQKPGRCSKHRYIRTMIMTLSLLWGVGYAASDTHKYRYIEKRIENMLLDISHKEYSKGENIYGKIELLPDLVCLTLECDATTPRNGPEVCKCGGKWIDQVKITYNYGDIVGEVNRYKVFEGVFNFEKAEPLKGKMIYQDSGNRHWKFKSKYAMYDGLFVNGKPDTYEDTNGSDPTGFEQGDRVTFHSLNEKHMLGRAGSVLEFVRSEGEYRVKLDIPMDGEDVVFIPPGCLMRPSLGKVKMTYRNGDYYEGDWGKKGAHGQGTMVYSKKQDHKVQRKYTGPWYEGMRHGTPGEMLYSDGGSYTGEWEADKHHGSGVVTYPGKLKIAGIWTDWNCSKSVTWPCGHSFETTKDGDVKCPHVSAWMGESGITHHNYRCYNRNCKKRWWGATLGKIDTSKITECPSYTCIDCGKPGGHGAENACATCGGSGIGKKGRYCTGKAGKRRLAESSTVRPHVTVLLGISTLLILSLVYQRFVIFDTAMRRVRYT